MTLPTNEPVIQEDSEGTIGSATPSVATMAGFKDGSGNLQSALVHSSGNLQTVVTDGTGIILSLNEASTTPETADIAVPVVISPNSSIAKSSTATLTTIVASLTSVTLLASNTSRIGATFVNDGAATLYLKFGSSASSTSYTYQLTPAGTLELPNPIYTGIITGAWNVATGNAYITEMTF